MKKSNLSEAVENDETTEVGVTKVSDSENGDDTNDEDAEQSDSDTLGNSDDYSSYCMFL